MENGCINWYKGFMAQTKRLEIRTEIFPNQVGRYESFSTSVSPHNYP